MCRSLPREILYKYWNGMPCKSLISLMELEWCLWHNSCYAFTQYWVCLTLNGHRAISESTSHIVQNENVFGFRPSLVRIGHFLHLKDKLTARSDWAIGLTWLPERTLSKHIGVTIQLNGQYYESTSLNSSTSIRLEVLYSWCTSVQWSLYLTTWPTIMIWVQSHWDQTQCSMLGSVCQEHIALLYPVSDKLK